MAEVQLRSVDKILCRGIASTKCYAFSIKQTMFSLGPSYALHDRSMAGISNIFVFAD